MISKTFSNVDKEQEDLAAIRKLIGPFTVVAASHIAASEHASCYVLKKRSPPDGHGGIIILLWTPESQVEFYSMSHRIEHGDTGTQAAWGWIPTRPKLAPAETQLISVSEGGV